eukprot:403364435
MEYYHESIFLQNFPISLTQFVLIDPYEHGGLYEYQGVADCLKDHRFKVFAVILKDSEHISIKLNKIVVPIFKNIKSQKFFITPIAISYNYPELYHLFINQLEQGILLDHYNNQDVILHYYYSASIIEPIYSIPKQLSKVDIKQQVIESKLYQVPNKEDQQLIDEISEKLPNLRRLTIEIGNQYHLLKILNQAHNLASLTLINKSAAFQKHHPKQSEIQLIPLPQLMTFKYKQATNFCIPYIASIIRAGQQKLSNLSVEFKDTHLEHLLEILNINDMSLVKRFSLKITLTDDQFCKLFFQNAFMLIELLQKLTNVQKLSLKGVVLGTLDQNAIMQVFLNKVLPSIDKSLKTLNIQCFSTDSVKSNILALCTYLRDHANSLRLLTIQTDESLFINQEVMSILKQRQYPLTIQVIQYNQVDLSADDIRLFKSQCRLLDLKSVNEKCKKQNNAIYYD